MIELSHKIRDALLQNNRDFSEIQKRKERNKLFLMYPWEDNMELLDGLGNPIYHARSKYPKHMEFFKAGATHRERCAMAANRIGKSLGMGGYEVACHLTGWYPSWWKGKRFNKPIKCWVAGKTTETTRDIIQAILMGSMGRDGVGKRNFDNTGLLPVGTVSSMIFKKASDLLDTCKVKHQSGGYSHLGFKTYEQGRGSFEGTEQHVVWFDEEPPLDVYSEAVIRTMTTGGICMMTFTPLEGMSETVMQFLPDELKPDL